MSNLQQFADAIRFGQDLPEIVCPNYSTERGLEVYRNNYRGALQESLALAYPVLQQLLGDEFFRYLAKHFIAQQALQQPNLHDYGAELAVFLQGFSAVAHLPYLPDMARLEWAYHRAYFAADQTQTLLAQLAQVSNFEQVRVCLHNSCCLLTSNYPISSIWFAHQQPAVDLADIAFSGASEYLLIYRTQLEVQVVNLPGAQYFWLSQLQQGLSLEHACDATMHEFSEFDVAGSLQHWAGCGVLNGLEH